MSTDSEESLLEDALRADLPPPGAQARLQKRLLAAGVAVGNGIAATSAAAAGAAGPTAATGVVGKALAMSWGVKLGALAAVAIPAVGLLVDSRPSAPALSAPAPVKPRAPTHDVAGDARLRASLAAAPLAAEPEASDVTSLQPEAAEPPTLRSPSRSPAPLAEPAREATAERGGPSQSAFDQVDEAREHQPSTLAEETRLLDAAFAELTAGNAARARELIAEHERRFPAGLLKQERKRAQQRLTEISRGE
jgi:hypothetical protein